MRRLAPTRRRERIVVLIRDRVGPVRAEDLVRHAAEHEVVALLVQVLGDRPGEREAVEGRGAAADLVEEDQAARGRLAEDRRRLAHLDHERRLAAAEVVSLRCDRWPVSLPGGQHVRS